MLTDTCAEFFVVWAYMYFYEHMSFVLHNFHIAHYSLQRDKGSFLKAKSTFITAKSSCTIELF